MESDDRDAPESLPEPTSRDLTRSRLALAAAFGLTLVVVVGWLAIHMLTVPDTHPIGGVVTAPECGGGYRIAGADVTVRDEKDQVIGATTTKQVNDGRATCSAIFSLVVPRAKFYQFKVGTHGGPSFSFDEMEQRHWGVTLSLG